MLLFFLTVIGVTIYFIFFANKKETTESGGSTAMDLLKERFINGEIDEDEYTHKKSIIEK